VTGPHWFGPHRSWLSRRGKAVAGNRPTPPGRWPPSNGERHDRAGSAGQSRDSQGRVVDSNLAVRFLDVSVAALGYTRRIPPQGASFDSRGQAIYSDGENYLIPDADQHGVRNWWKMFNRRGRRTGTYDERLNRVKD
jgi:hypothetical protein